MVQRAAGVDQLPGRYLDAAASQDVGQLHDPVEERARGAGHRHPLYGWEDRRRWSSRRVRPQGASSAWGWCCAGPIPSPCTAWPGCATWPGSTSSGRPTIIRRSRSAPLVRTAQVLTRPAVDEAWACTLPVSIGRTPAEAEARAAMDPGLADFGDAPPSACSAPWRARMPASPLWPTRASPTCAACSPIWRTSTTSWPSSRRPSSALRAPTDLAPPARRIPIRRRGPPVGVVLDSSNPAATLCPRTHGGSGDDGVRHEVRLAGALRQGQHRDRRRRSEALHLLQHVRGGQRRPSLGEGGGGQEHGVRGGGDTRRRHQRVAQCGPRRVPSRAWTAR